MPVKVILYLYWHFLLHSYIIFLMFDHLTYQILLHPTTYQKTIDYHQKLQRKEIVAGVFLRQQLQEKELAKLSPEEFIELLFWTKKTTIFAESAVAGDGSDWNQIELSILGDIAVSVPVQVFDNGQHRNPLVHTTPFEGMLLYTPGALLRSGHYKLIPADWNEVTQEGKINFEHYYQLYKRRLLPVFDYANQVAQKINKQGLVTVPGLGCGQFAGKFQGKLGRYLELALIRLLQTHGALWPHLKAVYYDPYQECQNAHEKIHHLDFLTRPLTQGNQGKSQLAHPSIFNEQGLNFQDCFLFSLVAWDHVSWPGNDYYAGSRATDDGVKAAATDSMYELTNFEGYYSSSKQAYLPPKGNKNWNEVVKQYRLQIPVKNKIIILPK